MTPFRPTKAPRSKYGNIPTNGHASAKESRRAAELRLMERAGQISNLRLQPVYRFEHNGQLIARYIPDADYLDHTGKLICEDTKSVITQRNPVYRLKKRMMKIFHSIEILET
jgi:hypothetical protein